MPTPPIDLVGVLQRIEPGADFVGSLPKVASSTGSVYYAKIGSESEGEQYTGEARSLQEIIAASPGLAPKVISLGSFEDGRPYMITEYKEIGHVTDIAAISLGKKLAMELHTYKSPKGFGFDVPTFCGATRQPNGWYQTWEDCFSVLLGNLLNQLAGKGRYDELCRKSEEVRTKVIPKLLRRLVIQPVLLHGDLWSGNIGQDQSTGEPFIFDPSSYFGHNEAEWVSMSLLLFVFPVTSSITKSQIFPENGASGRVWKARRSI